MNTTDRLVALTFDDGPDPGTTPQVLGILERFGAHATFFVLGRNVRAHPELLRAAAEVGNEIANHTYDHPHVDRITADRLASEIRRTSTAIASAGVHESAFFRPPKGLFDHAGARTVRRLGYRTVGWTLTLEKFVQEHGARRGVEALAAQLRPGGIVVAHDGPGRFATIRALPLLLARLMASGYRVVTVGQLFAAVSLRADAGEP